MSKPFLVALAIAGTGLSAVTAQQPQEIPQKPTLQPAVAPAAGRQIPLRVQFTLSRFQGEKKISSVPFMLGVLSNSSKTSLRMGTEVPVATTISAGKGEGNPISSYTYRDVGTNIDCQAQDVGNGQFNLTITVEDSAIHIESSGGAAGATAAEQKRILRDVPAFRSFRASFNMILRDGQTMQYASGTDPISGEVVRVDVALALAK
jgi:Bacterial type II and III secretion system protein